MGYYVRGNRQSARFLFSLPFREIRAILFLKYACEVINMTPLQPTCTGISAPNSTSGCTPQPRRTKLALFLSYYKSVFGVMHRELLPELQENLHIALPQRQTRKSFCALICISEKDFCRKVKWEFPHLRSGTISTRELLLLYRDRAGTKPLFYTQTGSSFVFGSEPKALFCHPDVTPSIDKNSLQEILAVGPARTSGNGVFTGVKEVMPGHYQIFVWLHSTYFDYWRFALPGT